MKKIEQILFKRDFVQPKDKDKALNLVPQPEVIITKYLVKFLDEAYIHAKWLLKEELEEFDGGVRKLKKFEESIHHPEYMRKQRRFELKMAAGQEDRITYYNPQFDLIDRVISKRVSNEE